MNIEISGVKPAPTEAEISAVENVLGQRLTNGGPCFGESVTEGLHLRDQLGMGNRDGAARTDLLKVG